MAVIETLKGLSPSAVDFELRSLSDDLSGKSLLRMLQVLTTALQVRGTERLSHGSQPFVLGLSVESMFHMPIFERQMLQMSTQSRRDFEVTQAYLHSTLRLHSTVIARSARYAYINPVHISRPAQSSQRVPCCVMCRLRAARKGARLRLAAAARAVSAYVVPGVFPLECPSFVTAEKPLPCYTNRSG